MENIIIKGARENNLKNIDVTIPRGKLVVFTGVSGSGKSSLAFDTIFAEGQRRYIESLSSYARMFLGQMEKPDVDSIEGLSPAVSIDQKTTSKNPRSTVGTVTEIYDYLRLLFARIGKPHCPVCGREIRRQSVDEISDAVIMNAKKTGDGKAVILAPVVRGRKGEYARQLADLKKSGYIRVRVDGIDYGLDEEISIDKNVRHTIYVTVDRIILKDGVLQRLTDSLETAIKLGNGLVVIDNGGAETLYSTKYSCPDCDVSIEEIEPRLFSFNSPFGACPDCTGLGFKRQIDLKKIIKDENLSIKQGGLSTPSGWNMESSKMTMAQYRALSKARNFSLDTPIKDLPKDVVDTILYGNGGERVAVEYDSHSFKGSFMMRYEGIIPNLMRRYRETSSETVKREIEKYMTDTPCPTCRGKRLKKEALAVTVGGYNIADISDLSVAELLEFFKKLELNKTDAQIAASIVKEITARLNFLNNVGLDYLTLARSSATLSGGESQRIRLATQIGSGLTGVLYILDEPSIGLHQKDNARLLESLKGLRDLGNTLIVVEHDEETINSADYVVDIGVGAGEHGGNLVVAGSVDDVKACERSLTGKYLKKELKIDIPTKRRIPDGRYLSVKGARQNNLQNIDVDIPVGLFTVVTGVSGSGKSSLVNDVIYPKIFNRLYGSNQIEGDVDDISGVEYFDKIINIDQSPIGRTPRSNPATYTGVFTFIRELFAKTPDAKARGYTAGRFSFNIPGGRCENCAGDGTIEIEMHFLPDIYVPCEICHGKRYNRETLEVKYKGKSIFDILDMTVEQACELFKNIPQIYKKIKTLEDVGLGYIKLGQSSLTLSGGEAQRVKLATELAKRSTGKTLYILDEPTTGLHPDDIKKLIKILQTLADGGNTVLVIEHNTDVIKVADNIIDLGPDGGNRGGRVICTGTPERVAECGNSYTGEFLKNILTENS